MDAVLEAVAHFAIVVALQEDAAMNLVVKKDVVPVQIIKIFY